MKRKDANGFKNDPLEKTEKMLKNLSGQYEWIHSLYQEPEFLKNLNMQRFYGSRLDMVDSAFQISDALSSVSIMQSKTPSFNFSVVNQWWIDISNFELNKYNSLWNDIKCSAAFEIDDRLNNIIHSFDLSKISALECETAQILHTANINTQMGLPSIQIAQSLSSINLNSLTSSVLNEILNSTSLFSDYTHIIEKQYINAQRNVSKCDKYLQTIQIATDIVDQFITSIGADVEYTNENSQAICFDPNEKFQNTVIKHIPRYLGYAFRNNADYDIQNEFKRSMPYKIAEKGKSILSKITVINDMNSMDDGEQIFKTTNKCIMASNRISVQFCTNEDDFGCIVDSLYFMIYESTGNAKRLLTIVSNDECDVVWNIKHLRTDFRHDIEHGDKSKYVSKKKLISRTYQQLCGKLRPVKEKDWVTAQYNLFCDVDSFLNIIIEKTNK